MPVITMPDGANVAFPDNMPPDQIKSLIQQRFPNETGQLTSSATSAVEMSSQERAAPVSDNLVRGSILPLSRNKTTGEVSFDSDAGIIGAIKSAFLLPGDVMSGKAQLMQPTVSDDPAAGNFVGNATPGFGQTYDPKTAHRIGELAKTANPITAPMRTGGAQAAAAAAAKPKLPEIEAIKESARAAYKTAEEAGVVISPKSYGPVVKDIAQAVAKEGIDPTLHPGSMAALKRLAEVRNEPITLSTLDTLRQVVKAAASKEGEGRIAGIMIDKIDDFVRGIGIKDVVAAAGNPTIATKALFDARKLWATSKNSELIEGAVERAAIRSSQFSGSGYENALRTEFRQLAMNKNKMKSLPKDVQDAIRDVAKGGVAANVARAVGKFAPTGAVSSVLGGGAGYAAAGGIGAIAVPAIGFAGRQVATKLTERNVNKAREAARGYKDERPKDKTQELLRELLARSAILGGSQLLPRLAR